MKDPQEPKSPASATILVFPRKKLPAKRGRPKLHRPDSDTGTPELVMKKLLGDTMETLDLCLERQLITKDQHWCGIHFRWLYTLRFGAPGVHAIDTTHIGGSDIKTDDPKWREAREMEYHEAVRKLTSKGNIGLLLNICVHNERPAFLNRPRTNTLKNAEASLHTLKKLRDGLDILAELWGRGNVKKKK